MVAGELWRRGGVIMMFLTARVGVGHVVKFGDVRYGAGRPEDPTVVWVAGGGAAVAARPQYPVAFGDPVSGLDQVVVASTLSRHEDGPGSGADVSIHRVPIERDRWRSMQGHDQLDTFDANVCSMFCLVSV